MLNITNIMTAIIQLILLQIVDKTRNQHLQSADCGALSIVLLRSDLHRNEMLS